MFTVNNTMSDVFTAPVFTEYSRYLIYSNPAIPPRKQEAEQAAAPISALREIGWSPEGIVNGLNCFADEIRAGHVQQYFVYDKEEITDPQQEYVNLIHIRPANFSAEKPAVVLCAGGAYCSVCTMVEALPTARHFIEAGYQVFLFTYRVLEDAVTPRAIDDLARAVKYLIDHREELCIDPDRMVFGGFSAGANLISNWGAPHIGYRAYGMPKPLALMPIYTYIDLKDEAERSEDGGLLYPMFGKDYRSMLAKYHLPDYMDGDYPPCYLVCGKDDTTVPAHNSELFAELLTRAGVPVVLHEGEHAPHGFGDGSGTDVEGWPGKAMEFIRKMFLQ